MCHPTSCITTSPIISAQPASHLGSTSIVTSAAGVVEEESDFYPFGTEVIVTGPGLNELKFTGKRRDSESQLDYFGARYHSNAFGRFLTPDWASKAVAVPYADFGNPQSLNLYSYAKNSPLSTADLDGHCDAVCIFNTVATIAAGIGRDGGVKPYAKNLAIGSGKGLGALAVRAGRLATAPNVAYGIASQATPLPQAVTPSNLTQAQASFATQAVVTTGAGLAAGPAIGALESASMGAESLATTAVTHFTSDARMAAISESGTLNAGTWVTLPSEIPAGSSSSAVENLLEIGPGKGANSITFDTPSSNLVVPGNGPTTSGGAVQFQLSESQPINPANFTPTPR
jgi:RHS repeat-associated protein